MKVPFVDLVAGIQPHRDEYLAALTEIVDSAYFAGGPAVETFERAFAEYCGADHAVAVSTGTDALILALRALGVGPGDEVITAPNSFFATAEAISLVGATPVFADVDDETLTLDPDQVAEKITDKTRAIAPVHLFGQVADIEPLEALALDRGLLLIEDSAQAHGATRNGRRAGSIGHAAGFSFYPAKNLGAFGEGGAITTGSAEVAALARALRDHGQEGKHNHVHIGYNARLPSILCACLSVRLRHLDAYTDGRRRAAARYHELLADLPEVRVVSVDPAGDPVYHLFVVRVTDRDRVARVLGQHGVATAVHYPRPIHLQPAYEHLGLGPGSYPVAERAAGEILSLPMYPELTDEAIEHVVGSLRTAVG
ncbi:MAG TPA: DegT/DnrJ/EryC1/StrS family aminotransferase [Kofleriaceae bacterium]|nr:DegT/DnrJ/EryC1/StrS family aminotransferase [Kofleriaceae bacterium]